MPRKKVIQTSSGPVKAKKQPAPIDAKALLERFGDYPAIKLIERQLANPGASGSLPILIKRDPEGACVNSDHQWAMKPGATKCHVCGKPVRYWHVRFINTTIENQWAKLKEMAYLPVRRSEILDQEQIAGMVDGTADDYVRRGDIGKEILMKRPLELHLAIKREEHRRRNADANSKKKVKASLAETAGQEMGDEAGQFVHDGGIMIESMSRTKRSLGDEADVDNDSIDQTDA